MRKLSLSNGFYTVFLLLELTVLVVGCGDNFNGTNSRRNQFGNGGNNNGARNPRNVSAPACPNTLKAANDKVSDSVHPAVAVMNVVDKTRADAKQVDTVRAAVTACDDYFKTYDANLVCTESTGRIYRAAELKRACDTINIFVN